MSFPDYARTGYVVKRYPRYSETFIVNEILAHEKAGLDLEIFSLRPPVDTRFQPAISRVKAPVTYLTDKAKMSDFWRVAREANQLMPDVLREASDESNATIVFQAIQLAVAVKEKQISHLHAHFATSATAVARLASRLAGITYSFTAHAKDIFHESVDPYELRSRLRDAASIITVSDFNLNYLQDTFRSDADHVIRIYNGLELDRFPYASPEHRPPKIVAVGRLVEKKGFKDLIDACAILADRGLNFKCQIIGEGALKEQLQSQIEQLHLNHVVELLGPRPQDEIVGILQGASVFAAPCVIGEDGNRDGLPTVLLESMALGTPCISTDVTGIPEILKHDTTGLLVPQHDAATLSSAIARLLHDPALRIHLSTQARHMIESLFDIHRNAAEIRKHFTTGKKPPLVQRSRHGLLSDPMRALTPSFMRGQS